MEKTQVTGETLMNTGGNNTNPLRNNQKVQNQRQAAAKAKAKLGNTNSNRFQTNANGNSNATNNNRQKKKKILKLGGEGVLAFDESHKAKNLRTILRKDGTIDIRQSSKTGLAVYRWQLRDFKNAKVMYASATAATSVSNMGYMCRLGLWGRGKMYDSFKTFESGVSKGGVTAMEMLAINLKASAIMSCRSLSYRGTSFEVIGSELRDEDHAFYDQVGGISRGIYSSQQYIPGNCGSSNQRLLRCGRGYQGEELAAVVHKKSDVFFLNRLP
jgi:hypothetical protein